MPNSYCHGSLIQGIFQGSIYLPTETFHVEKSTRFFNKHTGFHSVIYRESDIRCIEVPKTNSTGYLNDVLSLDAFIDKTRKWKENSKRRPKRAISLGQKNTCALYLRSDPLFWARYLQKAGGDHVVARQEILATFASHVQAVNNILAKTVFQTYGVSIGYSGLQLAIARTRIMTNDDCLGPTPSPYCTQTLDADAFLNLFSAENHDLFCLAYAFTYRDFARGDLGQAWIASTEESRGGGICDKHTRYNFNGTVSVASLNTGIISTVNYGKELSPRVSHLNFAHQIGHSLGSQHDNTGICAPFGTSSPDADDGNYIMFDGVTSGDRSNNEKFSACSQDNITRVLDSVLRNKNCLIKNGPFCGNSIVEEGEDCDCGFTDDCGESCCTPRDPGSDTISGMCKHKVGKECSPSQGPCCSETCHYVNESQSKVCSLDNDCKMASYCSGSSAVCPVATNRPDGHFCGQFASACHNGECKLSLCERIGWRQCFVKQSDGSADDMCLLACKQNATSSSKANCTVSSDVLVDSFREYKQLVDDLRQEIQSAGLSVPTKGVYLAIGSPCNNYIGYCDTFHKCRSPSDDMFTLDENEVTTVSKASRAGIRIVNIMSLYIILQAI